MDKVQGFKAMKATSALWWEDLIAMPTSIPAIVTLFDIVHRLV